MSTRFTRAAQNDLDNLWTYIAADNEQAADAWIDTLEQACHSLVDQPKMGRKYEDLAADLRGTPIGNYIIFYRLVENDIDILRVLHGAQDIHHVF